MQKHEKMEFVAEHVVRIILVRGLSGLSYAQVAKSAGVSRAWLYKYVGQTKDDLIQFAILHFGKVFSQLDVPVACKGREDFIEHRLRVFSELFGRAQLHPWSLPMYFRYSGTQTVIGDTIRDMERRFHDKLTGEIERYLQPKAIPPRVAARMLASMNLGIVFQWQNLANPDPRLSAHGAVILRGFLESIR